MTIRATCTITYTGPLGTEVTITGSGEVSGTVLLRSLTSITLTPSVFSLDLGESENFTATLTSNGEPLAGKAIKFEVTAGQISPTTAMTDDGGEAKAVYTAPAFATAVVVTASFAGDENYRPSSTTATGSIGIFVPELKTVTGASFPIPETIEDDVQGFVPTIPAEVQDALGVVIPTTGFLLANENDAWLVLATRSEKGLATVEGWEIPQKISLGGFELGVIVAREVSFTREGVPATVSEILANPEAYEFELVKIEATRRHVSVLYDPDDGSGIEFPVTAGYLVEHPVRVLELIKDAVRKGREFISRLSEGLVQGTIVDLDVERDRLPVFDFETDYWIDCPAVTNGIVLLPGNKILKLLENIVPEAGKLVGLEEGKPILYDVLTNLNYAPVLSVREINQNPDAYRGEVVGLTVYGFKGTVSIQEALREIVGLDVPLDVLLEGMIIWNEISMPPSREEFFHAVGASSAHQDEVYGTDLAEFRLIGKVVSTKQIDESLPEGLALVIFEEERIRDVTIEELIREIVEENLRVLNWVLTNFSEVTIPKVPSRVPPVSVIVLPVRPIVVPIPEDLPELVRIARRVEIEVEVVIPGEPLEIRLDNSKIAEVRVQLKEAEENVRVIVQKLETKPPELPDPPGLVWAYHNISLNVSPDVIENAWIEFWVLKEWLATQEVEKENILMLRFHAGKWEELPTEFVLDNGTHLKFRAYTPGFSPFVVVAETPPKPEVEVPEIPLIPLAVLSLVIVGAAAALLLKKRAGRPPVPIAF